MKMFLSNCTRQNQVVHYRFPGAASARAVSIDIGRQASLEGGRDLTAAEVDYIAKQLAQYGIVKASDVDRAGFVGLCWSPDKPISPDTVVEALRHNDEILTERGAEYRKEAAVAISNALEQTVQGEGTLKRLDVSIEELDRKDGGNNNFVEGLRVQRDEKEPRPKGGRGRKR